jgi:hypothetical protein
MLAVERARLRELWRALDGLRAQVDRTPSN